jgi:hypothetical protein
LKPIPRSGGRHNERGRHEEQDQAGGLPHSPSYPFTSRAQCPQWVDSRHPIDSDDVDALHAPESRGGKRCETALLICTVLGVRSVAARGHSPLLVPYRLVFAGDKDEKKRISRRPGLRPEAPRWARQWHAADRHEGLDAAHMEFTARPRRAAVPNAHTTSKPAPGTPQIRSTLRSPERCLSLPPPLSADFARLQNAMC